MIPLTTYAHVDNNQIEAVGRLPNSARRLDDGAWVMGLDTAPTALQEATGWHEVTDTPRPDDTATTTHDRSIDLVAGTPTVVWTERDKTQAELDGEQAQANRTTIDTAITNALTELQTLIDAPEVGAVPAGTMTTAQLSAVVRSMRDVVQQNRAGAQRIALTLKQTIRLVRGDFGGID